MFRPVLCSITLAIELLLAGGPLSLLRYAMNGLGKDKFLDTLWSERCKSMRYIVLCALVAVLMGALSAAVVHAGDPPSIRCRWLAPDTGSPVHRYELQIIDVDGGLDTTVTVVPRPGREQDYLFEGEFLRRYISRVRGVDGQGRRGPWSNYSQIYVFEEEEPEP